MSIHALRLVGPHRGATGYERHVRQYIRCFHELGIAVEVRDVPGWNRQARLSEADAAWLPRLYRPVRADVVVHFCLPLQAMPDPRAVNVLHTMFEATRVTTAWVRASLRHRLVVVPATSSREAWIAGGMPRRRVAVCPEGVDTELFDGTAPPEPLTLPDGRPVCGFRTRFLTVGVAGPRKNLAGLLRTWMRATTAADDAVLIVKYGPAPAVWAAAFHAQVRRLEASLGRRLETAAPVLLLDRTFEDQEMPRLFAAATHYISMSFGEGWDQPMHEAAASNLRLIAPDHSAYRDYITPDVADVIPSHPVPAVFEGDPATLAMFAGARWWQPDEAVAARHLRAAIDGMAPPRASPRERIALPHTWERSTRHLLSLLEEARRGRGWRRFWP